MKNLLKIFFWILTALLSLLILAGILTQTSFFKSWLSDKLSAALAESLSSEVVIGHIDGTLFTNLEIHDILVTDQTDTIIAISNIWAEYGLLPLIDKRIVIQNLIIEMPDVFLSQNKYGEWNISGLFSGDSVAVIDSLEADSSMFDFSIELEKFSLKHGLIAIQSTEDLFPSEVRDINIDLSAEYRTDKFHLQMESVRLNAIDPDLKLEKLSFNFGINKESVELNNFELITGRNRIAASGNFKNNERKTGELQLAAQGLDLTSLHILLPDIIVENKRDLEFSGIIVEDSISLDLSLKSGDQSLSVNIFSENVASLFDGEQSGGVEFDSRIGFKNIILENWLELDMPVQMGAGEISINGWIKNQNEHNLEITGDFEELKYKNYSPDSLHLQAQLTDGNVKSTLLINSKNGRFNVQSEIDRLFSDPKIIAQAEIRNLNLQKVLDMDSIDTDLNFDIQFEYSTLSNPDYYSYIDVNMLNSRYDEYFIDLFNTRLQFRDSLYILDSLSLQTSFAEVFLTGTGNFYGHNDLYYTIQTRDLNRLGPILNIDSLKADGTISGALRGTYSSFTNHAEFDLNTVQFNTIDLDTLIGDAGMFLENNKFIWDGDLTLTGITIEDQHINQIQIKSVYEYDEIFSEINILYTPDIFGAFSVNVKPDSIITVNIPQIDFMFRNEQWSGYLKKMNFNQNNQNIEIEKFHVHCINCEDNRSIDANGALSMNGNQNFATRINDVDLNLLMQSLGMRQDLAGKLDLNLDISGTMQAPVFSGNLSLEDGSARDLNFQKLTFAYEYGRDQLLFDLMLTINEMDSLAMAGTLPIHISLTDSLPIINESDSIDIKIKSTPIPLSVLLAANYNFEDLGGTLICDLSINNTMTNPFINGNILIKDGLIKSPYWGIDYQKINMNLVAEKDRFFLKKFEVSRDDGLFDASGSMQLDFSGEDDAIISSDLKLMVNKFFITQHKDFELQISSDIQYQNYEEGPRIGGEIEIIRSNFYLPAVLERLGGIASGSDVAKPLLVKARDTLISDSPHISNEVLHANVRDTLHAPKFLEMLEGEIAIKINRNSWIRNPQLRMEIEGNLKMGFSEGEVVVSGPVKTVRGQYDILGRRFIVVEGLVEFQGRRNVNIPIKLEAQYEYRSAGRERKFLVLKVSGDLKNPVIKFYENLNELSQEDALSILLHGRKKNELNYSNQSDLAGSNLENTAAMGLVSNYLSDQVSRSIGDDLKLDVMEVNATDNWKSANFIIGKYITNDLFVTYKREFGQSSDNDLAPETITLEYEIWKQIYLQLIQGHPRESGVDLFFKIDLE